MRPLESYETCTTDEVAPVDDVRPGHQPEADALGAAGPRSAVHPDAEVPYHHSHPALHPCFRIHETRQPAFRHQQREPGVRPHSQVTLVPQGPPLWHQQVLIQLG